jgi:hypothetical protein
MMAQLFWEISFVGYGFHQADSSIPIRMMEYEQVQMVSVISPEGKHNH